jgi:hypothetical protein
MSRGQLGQVAASTCRASLRPSSEQGTMLLGDAGLSRLLSRIIICWAKSTSQECMPCGTLNVSSAFQLFLYTGDASPGLFTLSMSFESSVSPPSSAPARCSRGTSCRVVRYCVPTAPRTSGNDALDEVCLIRAGGDDGGSGRGGLAAAAADAEVGTAEKRTENAEGKLERAQH